MAVDFTASNGKCCKLVSVNERQYHFPRGFLHSYLADLVGASSFPARFPYAYGVDPSAWEGDWLGLGGGLPCLPSGWAYEGAMAVVCSCPLSLPGLGVHMLCVFPVAVLEPLLCEREGCQETVFVKPPPPFSAKAQLFVLLGSHTPRYVLM